MLKINLVPEVKSGQIKLKNLNLTMTTVAIIVGAVLLAIIIFLSTLAGYRAISLKNVRDDITKIEGELVAYKDLEEAVTTLEQGLADIKVILNGGTDWISFFEHIEKATPSDIKFDSLQVTGNNIAASLKGENIRSIERFIKSFTSYESTEGQKLFANMDVSGYSLIEGNQVTFTASFDRVGEIK